MAEQGFRDDDDDQLDGAERRSPKVLVIDDDDIPRASMCELLARSNIEALELQSPIGATQVASTHAVDVVVLDVQMPNLRGDMLAKLFRKSPRLKHIGVVLVSGCSSEELSNLAKACDADAVLTKRDVRTDLIHTVWRVHALSRIRARAYRRSQSGRPLVRAQGRGEEER